ncbi:lyase family protein [Heyndrickxia acidicola]|uniref:Lyase family protein n=1 Tax=Heyndrickxia acidicola TaxID=209389 RepID=A0ABU6MIQ5_9BACI|nr:lyase family protein [Heyndrickxia acidicola]MED1204556.1 lyase family protein [Heyndrickxia acidicola]
MKRVRIEEDFIGTIELPADALYGINTIRTVQNLSFSGQTLRNYPTYIQALAMVKKAAASANFEIGSIKKEMYDAINTACSEILSGSHNQHFVVDILHGGGGIGTNMNMNEVIANLSNKRMGGTIGSYEPVHPTEHINASQSTSDVCHTAIRMAIILSFQPLRAEIERCIKHIDEKAAAFQQVTTIARTCLQDGMQIQLGDTFSGYSAVIKRRLTSLEEAIEKLYQINIGGTVIGSGIGAPQAYRDIVVSKLCEVTGRPFCQRENLFDAAQNIDDLANVSSELRMLSSCLIKVAKDLRLLSSGPDAGFAEIELPAVQAGSSFFPGKVNPVIPETLIQCCFQVIGCDRVVQASLEHGELDLNIFEGAAGANVLDAMKMLENALSSFAGNCVKGIQANHQRCEELSNSFIPLVVKLKERVGYSAVSKLLKERGREGIKNYYNSGGEELDTNQ